MAHSNISIFVPHVGCPHMCAFCNQRTITGVQEVPHADDVKRICTQALNEISDYMNTEIAFFGGSFTAIPCEYMLELLTAANGFVGNGKFKGIRVSTRPDCIDREILDILKEYGVTSIELGAQSMCDHVLEANERGHTVRDVYNASKLIKEYGFELGLQMMVGLYKSREQDELETMKRVIEIKPRTVRIYPVAVLRNTRLAQLYDMGEYRLMAFDKVVKLCSVMLTEFYKAGIEVIRCGLHSSETVESEMVAGFYHPAFREICESLIYRNAVIKIVKPGEKETVYVSKSGVSRVSGHKKSNKIYFENNNYKIDIKQDDSLEKDEIRIKKDVYNVFKIT
ncbi:MAG: elongator complex protein 3 [Oscillospiraceae bacterium]